MVYALGEALSLVEEEGPENAWARHARNMAALIAGLVALGQESFALFRICIAYTMDE